MATDGQVEEWAASQIYQLLSEGDPAERLKATVAALVGKLAGAGHLIPDDVAAIIELVNHNAPAD